MTDLCDATDVREIAGISTSADDGMIGTLITRASAAIEAWCERELAPRTPPATVRFEVRGRRVDLAPHDLRAATSVTLHPESSSPLVLTTSQWIGQTTREGTTTRLLIGSSIDLVSDTWAEFGFALLDIAGTWGVAAIPDDVRHACALTAAAWMDRAVDAYGAAYAVDDAGGSRLATGTSAGIPIAARHLLGAYRRTVVA
jgi:hypothetical protein